MVFQKRLEYVSNGYQIPAMPRVPRSAKGKRSARKKVEDNQMCAFDLLATLAGKLLAEREGLWTPCKTAGVTSSIHGNMKETLGDESPLKGGGFDQVSCDESTFSPFAPHGQTSHNSKLHLKSSESKSAAYAPLLAKSDASKKDASANEFIASGAKARLPNKCFSEGYSTSPMVSCVCKVDDRTVVPLQGGRKRTGCLLCGDAFRIQKLENPMDLDTKPATLLSSDCSVEVPPYGNHSSRSFPPVRDGMESHADRDDGENSSGCTYPSSVHSKSFKAHCSRENRIRKMATSNYRKVDPASYDDGELSNDDGETKAAFRKQNLFYTRQRTRRSSFKRRRMFERCLVSASRGSCGDEAVVDSQVKDGIRLEASDLLTAPNGANNISCTRRSSHNLSHEFVDYPVKLSIESFRVPELFIEIPSNATVGSLKRTVMEAVMAILGDGLRVGVLLQGKKVRDDNKTLRQAGISHEDNKMDSLGFTLEPNPACSAPPHNSPEVPPCCLPICEPPPHKKLQAAAAPGKGSSNAALQPPPIPISTTNCSESDHDPCSSSVAAESNALIPMAAANVEALSVVPLRMSRRSDIIQRRIRRPFSVSEVESLVQAVEKLGTGRWRDVKLRAFDNAKHRTYVDLKDKWKTLVHTARISPQQRRGEPVPQELLDRVLSAHAYWSQQQARLPGTTYTG